MSLEMTGSTLNFIWGVLLTDFNLHVIQLSDSMQLIGHGWQIMQMKASAGFALTSNFFSMCLIV